ncbi:hypothetical protein GMMP13_960001 [Candidatus Magnetomoraceae bacterium gMMP-13]
MDFIRTQSTWKSIIKQKDTQLQEKDTQLHEKDTQLHEKDAELLRVTQEKDTQLQEKEAQIKHLMSLLNQDEIKKKKHG